MMKPFSEYPTKYPDGFTNKELEDMLTKMAPTITEDQFAEAMGVNTVINRDNETVYYKGDVYTALSMCIEKRERRNYEFD